MNKIYFFDKQFSQAKIKHAADKTKRVIINSKLNPLNSELATDIVKLKKYAETQPANVVVKKVWSKFLNRLENSVFDSKA